MIPEIVVVVVVSLASNPDRRIKISNSSLLLVFCHLVHTTKQLKKGDVFSSSKMCKGPI
jgi:hypothetical protein